MSLSRGQILDAPDRQIIKVAVPEWGENGAHVFVRTMTGTERDAFDAANVGPGGRARLENIRARLCAATICSESGELIFSPADVPKVGKKSAPALERIFDAARALNRIGEDVEETAKN